MTGGGVRVPLLDLKAQYRSIKAEIDAAVLEVLDSQQFILGPHVTALEAAVARYSGCAYGSRELGTMLAAGRLMAEGTVPAMIHYSPYSFFASAGVWPPPGARPVRHMILRVHWGRHVAAAVTRVRAIIPVHLFGQMSPMRTCEPVESHGSLSSRTRRIRSEPRSRLRGGPSGLRLLQLLSSKNLGGAGTADGGHQRRAPSERVRIMRSQAGP